MYPKDHRQNWFKGQGKWKNVDEKDWKNWKWQLKNRYCTLEKLQKDIKLTPSELAGCRHANHRLLFAITPYYFNLIDPSNPQCPIRKQVIPRFEEMQSEVDP